MHPLERAESLPLFSHPVVAADPSRSRHGGSVTSEAAHNRAKWKKRFYYAKILWYLRRSGFAGMTLKDFCTLLCVTPNAISGRVSELLAMGFIKRLKLQRDGCGVLVHRRFFMDG